MLTKDLAICIRAVDYSETSQILTLFTRANGKISAIAKGSKRPKSAFDGPIEVFSNGKIVFSDSNKEKLATLTEFEQQPGFTNLASNLFALNCCFFAAELVDKLTNDYDPHPELFDSFLRFLQDANEHRLSAEASTLRSKATAEDGAAKAEDTLSLLILFQLSLLKEIGLQPILNACVNCKTRYAPLLSAKAEKGDEHCLSADLSGVAQAKSEASAKEEAKAEATSHEIYFSSSANGLICKDCEASFPDKIRLTKNAANCLANVKLLAGAKEKTLNEIEKILIYHFTEILGRPPKMAKYILKD